MKLSIYLYLAIADYLVPTILNSSIANLVIMVGQMSMLSSLLNMVCRENRNLKIAIYVHLNSCQLLYPHDVSSLCNMFVHFFHSYCTHVVLIYYVFLRFVSLFLYKVHHMHVIWQIYTKSYNFSLC